MVCITRRMTVTVKQTKKNIVGLYNFKPRNINPAPRIIRRTPKISL